MRAEPSLAIRKLGNDGLGETILAGLVHPGALISNHDSPEIGVVAGRNRDIRGTGYDTTIGLRLKVPFATDARNAPRRAAAQADVLAAQAEYAGARRQIEAELAAARHARGRAQDQTPHAGGGAVTPLLHCR